jgi:DNA-binding transcriptional LysR family regulator
VRPRASVELRDLELLVAAAETGSLGQVASRYRLSQPAVSARMTNLERTLGLRLLDRDPSGTRLTPAGAKVVVAAREVLGAAARLARTAEGLAAESALRLRVAASLTVAEHLAPKWIETLREDLPEVSLTLEVVNSSQVLDAVRRHRVDLGFVEGVDRPLAGLGSEAVTTDSLAVVVIPTHPWAVRPSIDAGELAVADLIVRERGSGTREVLEEALRPWGGVRTRLELGSSAAILAAARNGDGPAVLSALAAAADLDAGHLCQVGVVGVDLSRTIRAIWPTAARPGPLARRLLAAAGRTTPRPRPAPRPT